MRTRVRKGGAHYSGADLVKLRELIERTRASGRELRDAGMEPAEIAEAFGLPEGAVRDLLSDAATVSPATMRAVAARKPRSI